MSAADSGRAKTAAGCGAGRRPGHGPAGSRRTVSASPNGIRRTRSAVEQAVRLAKEEPVNVRLLRVRPRLSGHVAMFFDPHELRAVVRMQR